MNKTKLVLQHLQDNKTITSMEAIQYYRATRLSAIIFNLRKNYIINDMKIKVDDGSGKDLYYKKYIYGGKRED